MCNRKKRLVCLLTLIALFLVPTENVLAAINYTYDANGNMTADGQFCYGYNEANLLVKVKNCASNLLVAEYVYDSEGIRIVKKEYDNNGVLKQTTYSPEKEYETKKLASGVTQNTSYYYANGELVAKKNPDGSKNMYHNDYLGSTSLLTDQNGVKIEDSGYYPYGEIRTGGTKSKYTYTGQEKDLETGLNYYGARYYNSHLRRFTQPDSVLANVFDPQQLNRYSYTRNNPMNYTDPDGNVAFPIYVAAGGSIFAGVETATQIKSYGIIHNEGFFKAATDPNFRLDMGKVTDAGALGGTVVIAGAELSAGVALVGLSVAGTGAALNNSYLAGLGTELITGAESSMNAVFGAGTAAQPKPYTNSRPAYGPGQKNRVVWSEFRQLGELHDPNTGEYIPWGGSFTGPQPWEMGHVYGQEYRTMKGLYLSGKISKEEFLKEYRNPLNYRPELPSSNRSHVYEKK